MRRFVDRVVKRPFATACWVAWMASPAGRAQTLGPLDEDHGNGRKAARASVEFLPAGQRCIDGPRLRSEISATLGRQVWSDAADVHLRIVVRDEPGGTGASITLNDPHSNGHLGSRQLSADDCAELEQSLALVLSLMLDFYTDEIPELGQRARSQERTRPLPSAGEQRPEPPASSPQVEAAEAAKPGTTSEPAPLTTDTGSLDAGSEGREPTASAPARSVEPWSFALAADGKLGWGNEPTTSIGGDLSAIARRSDVHVELGVGLWPGTPFTHHGGRVSLRRFEAFAMFCSPSPGADSLTWSVCGRASGSRVAVTTSGFLDADNPSDFGLWIGPSGFVQYRLEPAFLRLLGGMGVALRRARLVALDAQRRFDVYEMSLIVGELGLGVGVEFQ